MHHCVCRRGGGRSLLFFRFFWIRRGRCRARGHGGVSLVRHHISQGRVMGFRVQCLGIPCRLLWSWINLHPLYSQCPLVSSFLFSEYPSVCWYSGTEMWLIVGSDLNMVSQRHLEFPLLPPPYLMVSLDTESKITAADLPLHLYCRLRSIYFAIPIFFSVIES